MGGKIRAGIWTLIGILGGLATLRMAHMVGRIKINKKDIEP